MSRRQYPYFYGSYKLKPGRSAKCELCGDRATRRAEFQYSWFRSDDESTLVCDAHAVAARDAKSFHTALAIAKEKPHG